MSHRALGCFWDLSTYLNSKVPVRRFQEKKTHEGHHTGRFPHGLFLTWLCSYSPGVALYTHPHVVNSIRAIHSLGVLSWGTDEAQSPEPRRQCDCTQDPGTHTHTHAHQQQQQDCAQNTHIHTQPNGIPELATEDSISPNHKLPARGSLLSLGLSWETTSYNLRSLWVLRFLLLKRTTIQTADSETKDADPDFREKHLLSGPHTGRLICLPVRPNPQSIPFVSGCPHSGSLLLRLLGCQAVGGL